MKKVYQIWSFWFVVRNKSNGSTLPQAPARALGAKHPLQAVCND